ncbi:hypothetical protein [Nocardioides nematodiphilus]|uniref:hypothetical protein n=1 Tax=Nocardioides nematodiphilus TaxID=2849669 RepID=UPI001CD946A9|nr:hypothetical protein [Nocardioides nematodiphilus]MCA1981458.1 hypothetical protein [Nocardioides nematodiphilus]
MTTPLRRKLALAAGLVTLGAPVLSSCGFDYATDRPNVIAHGGFHVDGDGMRVLATRIVAADSHAGVFIATIALNPTANAATDAANAPTLTGLSARGDSDYDVQAGDFKPVAVGDTGAVNLADPSIGGIPVTGDFKAGSSIPLTLTFSDGEKISIQTPVVTQCHEFADVAPQAGGKKAGGKATASASPSAEPDSTASSAASAPYDCSFPDATTAAE